MRKILTLFFSTLLSVSIWAIGEWSPIKGGVQAGDVIIFKDITNGFAIGTNDISTDYQPAVFAEFSTTNPNIQYIVGGTDDAWTFTVKSTNNSETPFCLTKGSAGDAWSTQIGTSANDTWSLVETAAGQYQLSNSDNSGKVLGTDARNIGSYLYRDKSGTAAITFEIYRQVFDTVVCDGEYYKVKSENLIPNGSFNDTLKYWKAGDRSDLSLTNFPIEATGGAIDDGPYIRSTLNNGGGGVGSINTWWTIDSTKTYLFTYYVKNTTDVNADSSIYLKVSTTKDPTKELNVINTGHWDANNVWTLNHVMFNTAATGDTLLRVAFRWLGSSYALDEFSLVEAEIIPKVDLSDLVSLIDSAKAYKDLSYPDTANLTTAIAQATAALGTIERKSELNEAISTLTTAINFYKLSPATSENPVDATFFIDNPSFESGRMGKWTASAGSDVGVKENSNGTYNMTPCDGSYMFNTWTNTAADNLLAQELTLPNGKYSMTAMVSSDAGNTITLYANAFSIDCPADTFGKAASKEYTLENILVYNNKLTIGSKSNNWYKVDHFRLTYYGKGAGDATKNLLIEKLGAIKSFNLALSPNGVDAIVTAAIATGDQANTSNDQQALADAIEKIEEASTIYNASLKPYGKLKTAIDSAAYLKKNTDYSGKAALVLALDTASAVYNADTTLTIHCAPATAKLEAAIIAYNLTKPASADDPVDYTSYISDPSFELSDGKTLGGNWVLNNVAGGGDFRTNGNTDSSNKGIPLTPDGEKFWNNWSNNFTSMEIYQDVANLPNGEYELTCYAITQQNSNDSTSYLNDQHLYATTYETIADTMKAGSDGFGTTNIWQLMKVRFYVTQNTARIGFASTFPAGAPYGQAGWWCIDDFHLYYLGANQNVVLENLNKLISSIKAERSNYAVPLGEDVVLDSCLIAVENFLAGSYNSDQLDSVLTATNASWAHFKSAQKVVTELDALIISATEIAEKADTDVYPQDAIAALSTAIEVATEIMTDEESLKSDLEAAIVALKKALKNFQYTVNASLENPADFTFAIVNPELKISSTIPDGWVASHVNGNGYVNSVQHFNGSGLIYFDAWNGTNGALKYNAHQDIADLPAGEYTFKMAARATINKGTGGGEDGVQIYALTKKDTILFSTNVPTEGDGNVSTTDAIPSDLETALFQEDGVTWNGWNDVTVSHILLYEGDTLQIGIDVGNFGTFTGTWFSGTDPRLEFLGQTPLWMDDLDNTVSSNPISIFVLNKRIVANGSRSELFVYNIAGMRVANEQLSTGIYIVRIDNRSFKVVVR